MKKETSASTSGFARGVSLILLILLTGGGAGAQTRGDCAIKHIQFTFNNQKEIQNIDKYRSLITLSEGQPFTARDVRTSLRNLYRTGSFSNIEIMMDPCENHEVNVYLILQNKFKISSIVVVDDTPLKSKLIKNAIYSLREKNYFEASKIPLAVNELRDFFSQQGYNAPEISWETSRDPGDLSLSLIFTIKAGPRTRIRSLTTHVEPAALKPKISSFFSHNHYIPVDFDRSIERVKRFLKKKNYYYPQIQRSVSYVDNRQSLADVSITVIPGYHYRFRFVGISSKMSLIATIWEKKVYEKWAERESRNRILNYLKNRGYFNARVDSSIETEGIYKTITFRVQKNRKYTLGKITFTGNRTFENERLREITKVDDTTYDRLIALRSDSLQVDLEVLKLFYYFNGFPFTRISMKPESTNRKVDLEFVIEEGQRYMVESILFSGNESYTADHLRELFETTEGGPFVQQKLNGDMQRLRQFYYSKGYDDLVVDLEISPGVNKSLLITINEGPSYRMWNTIIIGASKSQTNLIRRLFPMVKNDYFDRNRLNRFQNRLENSSIFSEITITKITRQPDLMDVLIKVTPDRSRYYGFGIGWEDRKTIRGTLEYQERNIFNSYSTFSAIIQLGFSERRGVLSYDTPYFLSGLLTSSLKIWNEDEIYPSYKFNRFGIGESLLKQLSANSYLLAAVNWYRTELTELLVTEQGVDTLDEPFDTTAFSLSYVLERRDDPFNPVKGYFFSTNLKIGLPLFEKNYSFLKFFWSYQNNIKFLNRGSISLSLRNGFATGEMSITERFFAGGIHTFRGTGNDRLGPIDTETDEPRGGNAVVLLNLEATLPFVPVPIENLYYSVFADFGNVFDKSSDFSLNTIEKAVGFGLKYRTPIGPLRIDLAWNLDRELEDRFQIRLGIGNVF